MDAGRAREKRKIRNLRLIPGRRFYSIQDGRESGLIKAFLYIDADIRSKAMNIPINTLFCLSGQEKVRYGAKMTGSGKAALTT